MKKLVCFTVSMLLAIGSYVSTYGCATCLARLKQHDKPFFMRDVSAQISTVNNVASTKQVQRESPQENQEHKVQTKKSVL